VQAVCIPHGMARLAMQWDTSILVAFLNRVWGRQMRDSVDPWKTAVRLEGSNGYGALRLYCPRVSSQSESTIFLCSQQAAHHHGPLSYTTIPLSPLSSYPTSPPKLPRPSFLHFATPSPPHTHHASSIPPPPSTPPDGPTLRAVSAELNPRRSYKIVTP